MGEEVEQFVVFSGEPFASCEMQRVRTPPLMLTVLDAEGKVIAEHVKDSN